MDRFAQNISKLYERLYAVKNGGEKPQDTAESMQVSTLCGVD